MDRPIKASEINTVPPYRARSGVRSEWREDKGCLGWFFVPKGQEESAQGFNQVLTLGTGHKNRTSSSTSTIEERKRLFEYVDIAKAACLDDLNRVALMPMGFPTEIIRERLVQNRGRMRLVHRGVMLKTLAAHIAQ